MPGMDLTTSFDPRIDQLSQKIQEIRQRKEQSTAQAMDATMDDAMNVVDRNTGRSEAREAGKGLAALSPEMLAQGVEAHSLNADRVADLISDPFED